MFLTLTELYWSSSKAKWNLKKVYTPRTSKSDGEIEKFNEQLKAVLNIRKKRDVSIVMGDYKAKIGEAEFEDIVGKFDKRMREETVC